MSCRTPRGSVRDHFPEEVFEQFVGALQQFQEGHKGELELARECGALLASNAEVLQVRNTQCENSVLPSLAPCVWLNWHVCACLCAWVRSCGAVVRGLPVAGAATVRGHVCL